jgi:hypothetical protein
MSKFTHPSKAKPGHKYITTNGRPARLLCDDLKSRKIYKLCFAVEEPDGNEYVFRYTESGKAYNNFDSLYDLIDAPLFQEGWLVLYEFCGDIRASMVVGKTKEEALDIIKRLKSRNSHYKFLGIQHVTNSSLEPVDE